MLRKKDHIKINILTFQMRNLGPAKKDIFQVTRQHEVGWARLVRHDQYTALFLSP